MQIIRNMKKYVKIRNRHYTCNELHGTRVFPHDRVKTRVIPIHMYLKLRFLTLVCLNTRVF